MKFLQYLFTALFSLLIWTTPDLTAQDRLSGKLFATRSEVISKNGMVATSHPLAGQIALDILKQGGTAADAAMPPTPFWDWPIRP